MNIAPVLTSGVMFALVNQSLRAGVSAPMAHRSGPTGQQEPASSPQERARGRTRDATCRDSNRRIEGGYPRKSEIFETIIKLCVIFLFSNNIHIVYKSYITRSNALKRSVAAFWRN